MRSKLALLATTMTCVACLAFGQATLLEKYRQEGREAQNRSQHKEAEQLFLLALREAEKLGENDLRLADTLKDLGMLYRSQEKKAEAERVFRQALAVAEKGIGPVTRMAILDHYVNLADLYREQGRHAEAEPLYRRAVAIVEGEAPDMDASVMLAGLMEALAEVYRAQSKQAEADAVIKKLEERFKEELAASEKAQAPDSLETIDKLKKLAEYYRAKGKHAEAEPLYRRLLAIRESASGPDSPEVAEMLHLLASLYVAQDRDVEAETLFQRALAIWGVTPRGVSMKRIDELALWGMSFHGPGRTTVFEILEGYAVLLHKMKREQEAANIGAIAKKILDDSARRVTPALPP